MTRPVVSDLTERIYELLEPRHAIDAENGYGLLVLCSAAAAMMEEAFVWSSGDDGSDPWQHLVDSATLSPGVPNEFLGQLLGLSVRVMEPGLAITIMEQLLAHMRGTVQYLEAVMLYALGADAIGVYERVDENLDADPYSIVVRSVSALSPQSLRLVHLWKPAGLIAHILDDPSFLYFDLASVGATYTATAATYATYADIGWPP